MELDFILNGVGKGDVGERLMAANFDPRALRPYIGNDGRSYITTTVNGKSVAVPMVGNATATLRKDEWKLLDDAVVKIARQRLKLVGDIRAAGLNKVIPNGMGKTVFETETQSDINDAEISMDGMRRSQGDRPEYELTSLPLPIIHKDFAFSLRQIQTSRNGGSPLDTTMIEMASRKVAELAEKLTLGTYGTYAFGGGTVYGLTNFPSRLTKVMTTPDGTNGNTTLVELIAMRAQAYAVNMFGPFSVYVSPNWDTYLDADFSTLKGDGSLRERLMKVNGINNFITLDYLTGYQMILVQMTSDVVRMVVGMEMTTLQWDTEGGMKKNFKVMAILVPQVRADQDSNCGIVHGTAP